MNYSYILIGIIYLLTSFSVSFAQRIDFEDGLVSYYPFNGSANDMTGNGNDGIINGATLTSDRYGSDNAAYYFNGKTASIRVPHSPTLDLSGYKEFTISMWVMPKDINSGCLIFKNYDYGIKWGAFKRPLTAYNGTQGGFQSMEKNNWRADEWYHIVMLQETDGVSVYINGVLDKKLPQAHLTDPQEEDVFIGKHPYFWGAFEGAIDDICIFNRALNKVEVDALYQIETMPVEVITVKNTEKLKATDVIGTWQGIFSQPGNRQNDNFAFWVKLEMKNGQIQGYSRVEIANTSSYGVMGVSGKISSSSVTIQEKRIIRQFNPSGFDWCMKFSKLKYVAEDQSLRGKWFSDNCKEDGEIILFRTQSAFNFYKESKGDFASLNKILAILKDNKTKPQQSAQQSVVNVKLDVEPITFYTGSSNLTSSSQQYLLDTIKPFLKDAPDLKLKVSGHTDNVGNDGTNLQLSIDRAKKVVTYLAKNGIEENRLSFEGYGKAKPMVSNDTAEGRKKNRRVEFEIVAQ